MKNNIILGSIILVLIVLAAGMGWMIYQNKVSDMDSRIVGLNGQISSLQSQNSFLQSQNSVLMIQTNQLNADLTKSKNLRSFASVEELHSFLTNNAGYIFNSNDESDVCIKRMLAAQDRGYWMGLMPKQTSYYNSNLYYNNYNNYNYYDANTPWIQGNEGTYRFFNNNYSSMGSSYSGVVNVAVVNGRDLYTIESGVAVYAGSMSTGF